jgi:lipopolysaccharide export system protein LptC
MTHIVPTSQDFAAVDSALPPEARLRTEKAYRRAKRHSTVVRLLKLVLPLIGLVMAAAIGGVFYLSSGSDLPVNVDSIGVTDGKLVMANPKLDGQTKSNLPYNLKAARAIQDLSNTDIIELEEIVAKLALNESVTANVDAATGRYDKKQNTLDINSPIHVETNSGMIADLQSAQIDLNDGSLRTTDPVALDLKGSIVTADSLTVTEKGKVFVFENRVRVTIPPDQLGATDKTQ